MIDFAPLPGPTIYAIDPGGRTGVAVFLNKQLYLSYTLAREHRHAWLVSWNPRPIDIIVVEDFTGAGWLSLDGKDTLKLIGQLEYICLVQTGKPPVYHRSQMKTPAFEKLAHKALKALPQQQKWVTHHVDSVIHGLIYLEKEKEKEKEQIV